jgi:DNA-binding response OmpR family regulator
LQNAPKDDMINLVVIDMNVLLVEDNIALCATLKEFFKNSGIDCDVATDGDRGLYMAQKGDYNVLILDISLPKMSGTEILTVLRKGKINTPVLMLTARDGIEDKEISFERGADDYLVKPFSHRELFLRIKALARRPHGWIERSSLQIGHTQIDTDNLQIEMNGNPLNLSVTEVKLLIFMCKHKDSYVSKEAILDAVWGIDKPIQTNNVEVYIHMLRKKLPQEHSGFTIDTKYGLGYKIVEVI